MIFSNNISESHLGWENEKIFAFDSISFGYMRTSTKDTLRLNANWVLVFSLGMFLAVELCYLVPVDK